jgi:hypothetical protein
VISYGISQGSYPSRWQVIRSRIGWSVVCLRHSSLLVPVIQLPGRVLAAGITAAAALADACIWSVSMCHAMRYPDLAQLAARSAIDAREQMEAVGGIRDQGVSATGLTSPHLETYEVMMHA